MTIRVRDLNWDGRFYDINGTATSHKNFCFKKPSVRGIHPCYGPVSGGTNITLVGDNLNIGKVRVVSLGDVFCDERFNNGSHLKCTTGGMMKRDRPSDINVVIDNARLTADGNEEEEHTTEVEGQGGRSKNTLIKFLLSKNLRRLKCLYIIFFYCFERYE